MASKEKLQSSVCSALFRNVNVPAPDADGPWSYTMAADVELVTTRAPSIDITITSSGNVLLPFMVLLLGVARKQRLGSFQNGRSLFPLRVRVNVKGSEVSPSAKRDP